MEAKELMIGDWVRINRDGLCIKKGTIVEVRGIDGDNKFPEKDLYGVADCRPLDKFQFQGGIWCEYLDPIPLTPEILLKNGFGNEFSDDYYGDEIEIELNLDQWVNEDEEGYVTSSYFEGIKYVHELQHALRLCGITKEIQI